MKIKWTALLLAAALCLGCTACGGSSSAASGSADSGSAVTAEADMFTDRDFEIGYEDYVTVALADSGSSADEEGVAIDGSTITVTQEGTYLLTGSLTQGQIVIEVADTEKVQLVLDNASVSNASGAAIYIKEADKVFLTTADGSENTLSVTGEYVQTDDNTVDAAIFSKADLTMNGAGTLTIDAAYGHGVVSKDDLVVTSGTYNITAASHGLSGKDSVRVADGTFSITSGKDGIHAENSDDTTLGFVYIAGGTFTVDADTDGIDAGTTLTITDGTFDLTTGGGSANASTDADGQPNADWGQWEPKTGASSADAAAADSADTAAGTTDETAETASAKGLKSGTDLTVSGGTISVDASDDAVHANGSMAVSGGTWTLASGDDGMHADAALAISGGTLAIDNSYEGIEAAEINLSDGTITVTASDDGLNAAGGNDSSSVSGRPGQNDFAVDASASIAISGGSLTVDASGDGLDSNGDLTVSGGTVFVNGPTNGGNGALDYGGSAEINGGIVVAVGSVGMAQNFSGGTQGCILYNLASEQQAGTAVTLTDSDGTQLASFAPDKAFQSIVISAPGVESGGTYTLTVGSETESIEMTDTLYSNGGSTGVPSGGRGDMGGGQPGGTPPDRNADAAPEVQS